MGFWSGLLVGGAAGITYGVWKQVTKEEPLQQRLQGLVEDGLIRATGIRPWRAARDEPANETAAEYEAAV